MAVLALDTQNRLDVAFHPILGYSGRTQGLSTQGFPGGFYPLKKLNRGPHCPLESPTLIFNFYFIEMKSIELWKHPLHHSGLWVPLQNEVPTRLGLGHYDCSTQSQGL